VQIPVVVLHVPAVWHWSAVHTTGVPGTHEPAEQWSPVVHAFPSLHDAVLFVCTHPVVVLQLSSVQGFPSLQSGGGPPVQTSVAEQVSAVVQALLSLQAFINSHLSLPSHFPVFPQTPVPCAAAQVSGLVTRGELPLAILEQVPTLPDNEQLWQPSAQALSQQTLSTQCPLAQSVPAAQPSPLARVDPQWWLGTETQALGVTQSAVVTQVFRQAEPEPHMKGSHLDRSLSVTVGQPPTPSQ
jgi:hypothetical protein